MIEVIVNESDKTFTLGENTQLTSLYAASAKADADRSEAALSGLNGQLSALSSRVYVSGVPIWDPIARVAYFPQTVVRERSTSGFGRIYTPTGDYNEVVVGSGGNSEIYIDTSVTDSAVNPFVVRKNAAAPLDATLVPVCYTRGGILVFEKGFRPLITTDVDHRVHHVSSNYPIIFIASTDTGYGITPGTNGSWMVPTVLRHTIGAALQTSTTTNTASTATDPTGTYGWSNYSQIDVNHGAETTLYFDVGARLVKEAAIETTMAGTKSGYVPLAVRHFGGAQPLQARSGLSVFYAGKDTKTLFGRVSALEADTGASAADITDGSRLRRYHKKRAILKSGSYATLNIASFGCDSWWDRSSSGIELLARHNADGIQTAGSGYISLNPQLGQSNGVLVTQADGTTALDVGAAPWVFEDASDSGVNVAAYLSGSGNAISTTANDRTFRASSIEGQDLILTYHDLTGAFRYRVNGGAYATITGGNTGNAVTVTLASGIPTGAGNLLEIDTTVNAGGTVRLLDLKAKSIRNGVQYHKMANGESTAEVMVNWIDAAKRELTALDVDLGILALGVNDQRTGKSPDAFLGHIRTLANGFFDARPNGDLVLVVPPRCIDDAAPGTSPMQDFGTQYATLYGELIATGRSVEIVRNDRLYGTYAVETAAPNTFAPDGAHLGDAEAYKRYVGSFYDPMMKRLG